MNKISRINSIN